MKAGATNAGEKRGTCQGAGTVHAVEFGPDGHLLAAASEGPSIELWSVADGKKLKPLRAHKAVVVSLAGKPARQSELV
jgi:hypothetical protein